MNNSILKMCPLFPEKLVHLYENSSEKAIILYNAHDNWKVCYW